MAAIIEACLAILQRYRARNMAVRRLPPPAYFMEGIESPFNDELNALALSADADSTFSPMDYKDRIVDLQAKAAEVKRRLREFHQQRLNEAPMFFAMIEAPLDRAIKGFETVGSADESLLLAALREAITQRILDETTPPCRTQLQRQKIDALVEWAQQLPAVDKIQKLEDAARSAGALNAPGLQQRINAELQAARDKLRAEKTIEKQVNTIEQQRTAIGGLKNQVRKLQQENAGLRR